MNNGKKGLEARSEAGSSASCLLQAGYNYELVGSEPLSPPQEWAASSSQTKRTWCKHICDQKWGTEIRMRILLRKKLGRDPTAEETEKATGVGAGVTPEDVRHALDNGEEGLQKCEVRQLEAEATEEIGSPQDRKSKPEIRRPVGTNRSLLQHTRSTDTQDAIRREIDTLDFQAYSITTGLCAKDTRTRAAAEREYSSDSVG
ncbi:hypothetical protein LshimejAT787_0100930 [Lyophyllum shimeji]|uniref:DUF6697 domain-containing protein n=1 Tax=Lyophyllum shimeji TaxID=47721 RepID=A0A9P3PCK0_LYOSH|nr:hypothetical protein LshimejAT787_0100930 [Lyophyllum shimeji]